jgi:hypothetical protein
VRELFVAPTDLFRMYRFQASGAGVVSLIERRDIKAVSECAQPSFGDDAGQT